MFTSASSNSKFLMTAVRHKATGKLVDFQSSPRPNLDLAPRIANAITEAGGTADDWELVAIPDEIAAQLDYTFEQTCEVDAGRVAKLKKGKRLVIKQEAAHEPDLADRIAELERMVEQLTSNNKG